MKKTFWSVLFIALSVTFVFASYTPDELVQSMKENAPKIKIEEANLRQSKADRQKAMGDFFPKIDYSLSGAYIANPIDKIRVSSEDLLSLLTWPEGVPTPGTTSDYVEIYKGMEHTQYSFGLSLTWPILTWGKLIKQHSIYSSLVTIQENNLSLEQKKSEAEIRSRYEANAYLNKLIAVLKQTKVESEELYSLVTSTTDEGMSVESDKLQAEVALRAAEYGYNNAVAQKDAQIDSLSLLTGIYTLSDDDLGDIVLSKEEYKKILDENDELSMVASAIRGDKEAIKMLNEAIKISDEREYISLASMPYAPDVSILASLSYGGSRFPFIENGWSSADDWNAFVGVNIKGTFFDGTKQYAEEKKTRAGQEKARLEMEKNVREIINTVKETRRSLNVTLSSIDYKETELKQKQELKRIAYEKYEARQITRIEYLKASLEEHVKQAEVYKEYIKLSTLYYTLSMLTQ